jgi:hypothetical protein
MNFDLNSFGITQIAALNYQIKNGSDIYTQPDSYEYLDISLNNVNIIQ